MSSSLLSFLVILGILLFTGILNYLFSFLQWYMAINAGIKITLLQLFRMRMKGMPVNVLLDNIIKAKQFNIPVTIDQLYEHHKNGGDVYNLIDGLVRAQKYGLNVTFEKARNADLQKIKLTDAVEQIAEYRGLKK